jgi:hypothetical protein
VPRVKVFISHATVDRRRAQRLGRLLEECGIEYWFSREHLVHGHNWYREIGAALTGCNWLVVVATKASVKNSWVRDEVTFALTEQRYRNRHLEALGLVAQVDSISRLQIRLAAWRRPAGGAHRRTTPSKAAVMSLTINDVVALDD